MLDRNRQRPSLSAALTERLIKGKGAEEFCRSHAPCPNSWRESSLRPSVIVKVSAGVNTQKKVRALDGAEVASEVAAEERN